MHVKEKRALQTQRVRNPRCKRGLVELSLDYDGINHASVQPGNKMSEQGYQTAIRKKRQYWQVHKS